MPKFEERMVLIAVKVKSLVTPDDLASFYKGLLLDYEGTEHRTDEVHVVVFNKDGEGPVGKAFMTYNT